MTGPDFDRMSKDELVAWFDSAEDISPLLEKMEPATDSVEPLGPGVPMVLVSLRLPAATLDALNELAALEQTRRSDIIRDAIARHVAARTAEVDVDEAERALDVLRRVVEERKRDAA